MFVCLFICFALYLFSCHPKATVVLYFGRILTRLEILDSKFSDWFSNFPINMLLVQSHQTDTIFLKRLIQGSKNVCNKGGSWTVDHVIVITLRVKSHSA